MDPTIALSHGFEYYFGAYLEDWVLPIMLALQRAPLENHHLAGAWSLMGRSKFGGALLGHLPK
jgi:hypothetical protein